MKHSFAILALLGILLLFAGCKNDPAPSANSTDTTTASTVETIEATTNPTTEPATKYSPILQGECYTVCYRSVNYYSFQITDREGNVLLSREDVRREPHIVQLSEDVIGVWIQAGTGVSTRYAQYCNIKTGAVSEAFQFVMGAEGNYVVYVDYEDGKHTVVVRHIFDDTAYRYEQVLADASRTAADVGMDIQFPGDHTARFVYFADETDEKKTIILKIPAD